MSDPTKAVDGPSHDPGKYHPPCNRCGDPCEELIRPGRPVYYTGLCRTHGELEFSERWQKRWSAADTPEKQKRLLDERKAWEAAGHVYRGVSDREDRRYGT